MNDASMRNHFSLDPDTIYLASGAQSICPTTVIEAVQRYQREYELNPAGNLSKAWAKMWKVQSQLASFFNADAEDLFLRTSVSLVMSDLILGVALPPGSEILTTNLEYPAITNACRYRTERDGLKLRVMDIPSSPHEIRAYTKRSLADFVVSQLAPETQLLVLCHVVTGNGLVFPIEEIAAETRKRGVLFMVDGAHAAGSLDLKFDRLDNVDFYGANLHKWMLGPKATAFGWVPKRNQRLLRPSSVGLGMYNPPSMLDGFAKSDFQSKFIMTGVYDFSPFFGISDMLTFWETHGPSTIRSTLKDRQQRLTELAARELGWALASPISEESRGPIISYQMPPTMESGGVGWVDRLYQEYRLQVSIPIINGKPVLRLTPYLYTSDDDLIRAISILKRIFSND